MSGTYSYISPPPSLQLTHLHPQLQLIDRDSMEEQRNVLFRYDPPVLIVGATWHQKRVPFVESLFLLMQQAYFGHEDLVSSTFLWHMGNFIEVVHRLCWLASDWTVPGTNQRRGRNLSPTLRCRPSSPGIHSPRSSSWWTPTASRIQAPSSGLGAMQIHLDPAHCTA